MQPDELKKAIASLESKVMPAKATDEVTSVAVTLYNSGSPDSHFWVAQETSFGYMQTWLRKGIRDKIFLDCTCGGGERVVMAAGLGAALSIGLNPNEAALAQAKSYAKRHKCDDSTSFLPSRPENTGLPNESVDVIIIDDFQNTPDLSFTFPELRRVLKPGGRILYMGTLDFNPFVKVHSIAKAKKVKSKANYHNIATFAQEFFQIGELKYWHVLATSAAYISNFKVQNKLLSILNPLDHYLAKLPGIRRLAWQFTLELRKKK
jgi:ubiquinone/menaquinone biosynthesis C-methylase UbiE